MNKDSKIFVAGHKGLVGSSIVRELKKQNYSNILCVDRRELELCDSNAVQKWFEINKPEYVFLAAAKVGGIHANSAYPADFIKDNLFIQNNVIDCCHRFGVKKIGRAHV